MSRGQIVKLLFVILYNVHYENNRYLGIVTIKVKLKLKDYTDIRLIFSSFFNSKSEPASETVKKELLKNEALISFIFLSVVIYCN